MYIQYGNYIHPSGTVALQIGKQAQFTRGGVPYLITERYSLEGVLLPEANLTASADLIADLTTKISLLEMAYRQQGVDLVLKTNAGSDTAHVIRHSNTLGGIRVIEPPNYPVGSGAEYATFRRFRTGLEANVLTGDEPPRYLDYQETLETWGGGPELVYTRPIFGKPQRQRVRDQTTYMAVQSGYAVGFLARPTVPDPIFPGAQMANPRIRKTSPVRSGLGDYMQFAVSWEYVFESSEPLFGVPHAQFAS